MLTVAPADPQLLPERAVAAGAELEPVAGGSRDVVFRDPAGQRRAVAGTARAG
ncbi:MULTISPECIES: hypothetical protein [unclassified Micromonospora]|uniref:hypothetical protein n=1 Tax=unclassified Micromonospora TaxID=2617518 RepID=UPI00363B95B6